MHEIPHQPQQIINELKLNTSGKPREEEVCPACPVHIPKQAGDTHCAFCGHEFQRHFPLHAME